MGPLGRDFRDVMEAAITEHNPTKRYVLFSGGNDSTGLLHRVIASGIPFDAAVHINTGIGIEQTREFVRETCAAWNVPLIEKHPPKMTYRDFVLKFGFPGPGAHALVYRVLKELAVDELVRESKVGRRDRIMLITGVRSSESQRRMGHVEYVWRDGCQLWVAPIADYTKSDLIDYRLANNVPENPVAALLHMSGECLCGAFAHPGEREELRALYPEVVRKIEALEAEVKLAGIKRCVWGDNSTKGRKRKKAPPLCSDCWKQMGLISA